MSKRIIRIMATLLLLIYIGFIIFTTLLCREPSDYYQYNFTLFWSYQRFFDDVQPQGEQIVLNILFFVPYGLLCSTMIGDGKKSWNQIMLVTMILACVLSGLVESLQLFLKLGFSEFDDVFDNTLGAIVGAGLFLMIRRAIKKKIIMRNEINELFNVKCGSARGAS